MVNEAFVSFRIVLLIFKNHDKIHVLIVVFIPGSTNQVRLAFSKLGLRPFGVSGLNFVPYPPIKDQVQPGFK